MKENFSKVRLPVFQLQTNTGEKIASDSSLNGFLPKTGLNKKVEQMALVAAFIFAMQMLNFPVQNGTSGHFLGAVLAAVVLGPWNGILAIASVLLVQAFVFSDGGILALGANIFNMGVVGVFAGNYIYQLIKRKTGKTYFAIAVSSWVSVVLAATACSLELALSKTIGLNLVLPAMFKVHMLIGLGEAIVTILAVKFLFYESTK